MAINFSEYSLEKKSSLSHLANIVRIVTNSSSNTLTVDEMAEALSALTNTEGLQFALNSNGTAYSVVGYNGSATHVRINSTYQGLPVESIGDNAFDPSWGNTGGIEAVALPNTIKSIGSSAFEYQNSLVFIPLPETLEIIGSNAFSGCYSLTQIDIPESVLSIGDNAFSNSGLSTIELSRYETMYIGVDAFSYCPNLRSAYLNYCASMTNHSLFTESLMSNSNVYVAWSEDSDIINADDYWGITANAIIHYDYVFETK